MIRVPSKIKWISLVVILIILSAATYYAYSIYRFSAEIQHDPETSRFNILEDETITELTPPKWESKERVNILLLGGDERGLRKNEVPRSDTIMVASLDPVTKKAYIFSILRDTYVEIPGRSNQRINAALPMGGPQLVMKTVSQLLGIPIQYYIYTDFQGFIALIDAIGGVDMVVEKDMKWRDSADGHKYDIDLKKGPQHLNGETALQYVRFRHDAMSDFARTERQRNFLKEVAQKLQSTASIVKLPKILSSVDDYIETNIAFTDMIKLGSLAYESKAAGLISEQLPPTGLLQEKRIKGADVIWVDPTRLQHFIQEKFAEANNPPVDETESSDGKASALDADQETGETLNEQ